MNPPPALDIEDPPALIAYLQRRGLLPADECPEVRVLTGGVSNRTVLVRREPARGDSWVLKQALAKLRVEVDWFCDPARMERETLALQWLQRLLPEGSVPHFVFADAEQHVLAMQAVPQPHENWKTQLLEGRIEPALVEQFGTLLGCLHRRAFERRRELEAPFADWSFFEALRLEPYYAYTAAQVPDALGFLQRLIEDARGRRLTLAHGDYSPKNVLVYQRRLVLLDHEVAHWGDPAFDLGFSLTHLLSKAHHLPSQRSAFAAAARDYWSSYTVALGQPPWRAGLEPAAVRHTLGCLLARAAGRSPLEYLSPAERQAQQEAVMRLMPSPPATVDSLVDAFLTQLGR